VVREKETEKGRKGKKKERKESQEIGQEKIAVSKPFNR
jgi:hypothetical protein